MGPFSPFIEQFQFDVALGVGLAIGETDDGRVIVNYLVNGGPADLAGIELGAELLEIDEVPVDEYISAVEPWTQPFSTPHNLRLEQLRFGTRFNANTRSIDVVYQNPDDSEPTEITLATANEVESFNNTGNFIDRGAFELPVEYDLLDSGYGYVTIASFLDNSVLTIQLWERMIQDMNSVGVPAIIIDMRQNGGGDSFLADQMAAYFFEDPHIVGYRAAYREEIDDFYFDPRSVQRLYPPAEDLQYHGDVVVLVGPNCASACERFAHDLTIKERAEIIGQYPTAGLGGGVNDFRMPEGVTVRYTVVRSVDADYNIHIEGTGVEPTVKVPITAETLLSDEDVVLDFAVEYLDDNL
jgi:C-terminal processing protease CtpA/Prc